MTSKQKIKKTLGLFLKLALVAAVFIYLEHKKLISGDAFREGLRNWPALLPGVAALLATSVIAGYRWWLLLQAQVAGSPQPLAFPLRRIFEIHYIGNFFNVALPGAVSGDFVKAFYIGKEFPGQRARSFGSILFDRVLGVSALVLVSGGALALSWGRFQGSAIMGGVKIFISIATIGVLAFYTYLFLVREEHDPALKLLQSLETRNPKVGSITRIYLGIRAYHTRKKTVSTALALSLVIHLLTGFAMISFAHALGQGFLSLSDMYVVIPIGLLVTAVPVLPGGVGTGHAAFGVLFQVIGSERGADAFSYMVIVQLLIGAVGGLVYLRFKSKNPEFGSAKAT